MGGKSKTYGGQGSGSHCKFKATKGAAKDKCMSTTKPKYVPGPMPKAK